MLSGRHQLPYFVSENKTKQKHKKKHRAFQSKAKRSKAKQNDTNRNKTTTNQNRTTQLQSIAQSITKAKNRTEHNVHNTTPYIYTSKYIRSKHKNKTIRLTVPTLLFRPTVPPLTLHADSPGVKYTPTVPPITFTYIDPTLPFTPTIQSLSCKLKLDRPDLAHLTVPPLDFTLTVSPLFSYLTVPPVFFILDSPACSSHT